MIAPPLPDNEDARLAALLDFNILDTLPEATYDRITSLAAKIFNVPSAVVSLVDEKRQWFKSCCGEVPFTETDRDAAFCAHAILEHSVFVIEDTTKDPRFSDHPMVATQRGIRFYAGAPLTIRGDLNVGTLCLVDFQPRIFSEEQRSLLADLAACVVEALEARESRRLLAAQMAEREKMEKGLQAILDNATSVIYLKDLEGRYLLVNRRYEEIFGNPREFFLGRRDHDFHPAEAADSIRRNDLQVQAEGQAMEFEETVIQVDGPRTYISVKFPMRDGAGKIYGICGISTDITSRIQAEEALRGSEARKAAILEAALDGIVTIDHLGRVQEINGAMCRIFGYTHEQMIGHDMADLIVPAQFREGHRRGMARVLATGEAKVLDKRLELPAMRADGSEFPVELTITRIVSDGPPMFTGHLRDITARHEAEKKLRQAKDEAERANSAKSHFLSRMSHELRTPLNAILGFGQVLRRRATDDWHREKLDFITNAGGHLLNLINEVLDLTRIEAGSTTLALEAVDLGTLLSECENMIAADSAARNVHLEFRTEHGLTAIADQQRLKQICLNLLSNAVKYNHDPGLVTVTTERAGDEAAIHFRDTGRGIAEDKLPRLFVPFDRLGAEETGVEGTGIGLALAQQLVELMGGRLSVSTVLGEGSTFTVTLPAGAITVAAEEKPLEESGALQSPPQTTRQVVLYAEDNHCNLSLMQEIAEEHGGVELITVMRGSEVAPKAREVKPRLILLDLHLPEMRGDEILRQIRGDAALRDTPVIMVSADAMQSQIDRLLSEGASEYITKPIDVTRILDIFDQYLRP